MKSQNVSFTGFIITKGPALQQVFLQSRLAAKTLPHNNVANARALDYVAEVNYEPIMLKGSGAKQMILHATGDRDIKDLYKITKGKNWVANLSELIKFIRDKNIQQVDVYSVIRAIDEGRFNPLKLEFIPHGNMSKIEIKKHKPVLIKHFTPSEIKSA